MKSKLIALILIAGASAFAQTRFSFSIGASSPGYYSSAPGYYYGATRPAYRYDERWYRDGAGYWGRERAEWNRLRRHQEEERYRYGDSPEMREHQAHERWELQREQWRDGTYRRER